MRHAFVITAEAGLSNAIRRTLISDMENWAPCKLTIRENTSCQTDEFIAHRVGLMPFRRIGNGDTLDLKSKGGVVYARDMIGTSFEAVEPDIPVMDLGGDSALDVTVHFDRGKPVRHARYSTCSAVAMKRVDDETHEISFQLHDETLSAHKLLMTALDALEARVDDCLLQIGRQPDPPPRSRCG
tara:strand:- start:193 stop:744 length:552 start_codon:yes stop_codon:yes gene_type:complete